MESFFGSKPARSLPWFSRDFAVRMQEKRTFCDKCCLLEGIDVDAVETGVLSEEGCGKEAQDFEFWHFFHEDQIQPVVLGIRFSRQN